VVVEGDAEFFRLTKRLHNRLHRAQGDGGPLGEAERSVYERRCAANVAALVEMLRPGDIVILHDPQTAGLLPIQLEHGPGRRG
jgi:trehalose synthase